jgi:alpha-tubulin suppressor-like RCC1 family protein
MKRASFIASICTLALSACSAPNATTGTLELSLKGAGSLGGNYQLTAASFTVTGPQNLTISGDPDTILQSLPVGVYNVKLENGWKLQKTVGNTSTDVVASVASANPQPVVVNAGTTSSVTWLFNVSGSNADADDLEIVAVSNGALSIALAAGEAAWSNFSTGALHSCGITATGQLRCFGDNGNGQLGYGDTNPRLSPPDTAVNLGQGRTAKLIAAGNAHTCAQLDDDSIKCWGANANGELGYEDTNQRSAPPALGVALGTGRVPRRLQANGAHTCVLLTDNGMKCWGYNDYGQFGLGVSGDRRGDQTSEMGDNMPESLP